MNTNIFETKEQYLNFRNHWRKLYADGYHKRVRRTYNTCHYNEVTKTYDDAEAYYNISPLGPWHHLMFALATGRDPMRAFGNYRKGHPSGCPKADLYWKLYDSYGRQGVRSDFTAFGDTLTAEQQAELTKRWHAFRDGL